MQYVFIGLLILNVISFLIMLADKKRATARKRRIPEAVIMGLAIVGGSLGVLAGMDIFRHKTRHRRFTIGIPVILATQVLVIFIFYYYL